MANTSLSVRFNSQYKRADGMSALYLRVIINRKKWDAPLDLHWPPEKFNIHKGECKKRYKNDLDYEDYNIIIRDEYNRANEIVKFHRMAKRELTLKKFREEFGNEKIKIDFLEYFKFHMEKRYKIKEITYRTYQSHRTTLKRLKEFRETLPFSTITKDFALNFEVYLRNTHANNPNTIHGRQKTVKYYMNKAIEEGIVFTNPFRWHKLHEMEGSWKSLTNNELKKLLKFYHNTPAKDSKRAILRRFLFSCFTGLRLSDLKNLSNQKITSEYLIINVEKGKDKKQKVLHLPLSSKSKELLAEEMKYGDFKYLFNRITDQYSNRVLAEIGESLEIRIKLHHHIGRETFATLYLEKGGKLEVLKEYLAHKAISSTMKYVHVSEKRKIEEIIRIDNV